MSLFGNHQLNSFDELFLYELYDLYDAEKRILTVLPRMRDAAHAVALRQLFEAHLAQTVEHVKRLDEVFRRLHRTPGGETSEAMKGLLSEGQEVIDSQGTPEVRDAALIAAAQRVAHYEIAGYGTVRTFAAHLGAREIADLLNRTLQEEMAADRRLTEIAENEVNARALQ